MPDEHGQLAYDNADLRDDCQDVAGNLEAHGIAAFTYAAFGTRHAFIAMDSNMLLVDRGASAADVTDRGLWGRDPRSQPAGVDPLTNSHTLWIRQNDNKGTAVWMNRGGFHDPSYLGGKFMEPANETDGYGLFVLFLLIEAERGLFPPDDTNRRIADYIARYYEMYASAVDREPPAFLEGAK